MTVIGPAREPLYRRLAQQIRQAITQGDLPPGSRLPSEQELIEAYDVSRNTVRLALGVLRTEGLIVTGQGRGSFVADPLPVPQAQQPDGEGEGTDVEEGDDPVLAELHVIRDEIRRLSARLDQLAGAPDDDDQ